MNLLHEAYIKTMCLKHGVQHERLVSMAQEYLEMFNEVLENNINVGDTIQRPYDLDLYSAEEFKLFIHVLKSVLLLPVEVFLTVTTMTVITDLTLPLVETVE